MPANKTVRFMEGVMHHRSGCWVSGHFRNGSWVEGHYRGGASVYDKINYSYSRQPTRNKKNWVYYGSITFETQCWWCGQDVYFHRDENGGCVLFDFLGSPWPVHDCWLEHKFEQQQAIDHILSKFASYIDSQNISLTFCEKSQDKDELDFYGYFVSYYPSKLIYNDFDPLVDIVVRDYNGDNYKMLIPCPVASELNTMSLVKVKGEWAYRGSSYILFATEISANGPYESYNTIEVDVDIKNIIRKKWIHRQLKT